MKQLKTLLKKIHWIYAFNAWIKARREKKIFLETLEHYKIMPVKEIRKVSFKMPSSGKINFFYLGTDELQDRSGILQAIEHFGNLAYFTKSDNSYGQYIDGTIPERQKRNADRLLEIFKQLHANESTPQILIAQTFDSYIDAKVFSKLRANYGTFIINIGMDDRHQYWPGTFGLIPHIDLALTAAPECVDWYLKEGCPAIFFPEASDATIFHPMPELPKTHDVSFVGAKYGIREKIVTALRNKGIQVTTYGGGWGSGFLAVDEVPKLFAQSKIILGVGTIGYSEDFYALKMRDFDGPMSGSCYITHDNPDLKSLFEIGKEMMTYKTVEDCVLKVSTLLKNDKERENIAYAGHIRAKQNHTWVQRFESLMNYLVKE